MRRALQPHPDTPCAAVSAIEVEVARPNAGLLTLRYIVTCAPQALRIPAPAAPERTDGLWRQTCFEAFIRPEPGEAYGEFNLAPSSQWAAYRFEGYRQGMAPIEDFSEPWIDFAPTDDGFELNAVLQPGLLLGGPARLGLSAVVEAADGSISYWALAHAPGKPDFHHADCFAAELPETEAP